VDTTVDSPLWYRVQDLRVRLRAHVRVQRREARGDAWYLLIDSHTGRFHRVNREAYTFVGRINGSDSVGALWNDLHGRLGEEAPTQGDVLRLLAQLADADLIAADALPDLNALLGNRREREQRQRLAAVNPLAFKVPLFDPTRVLDALLPLGRWIFSPLGFIAWLVIVGAAFVAALVHAPALGTAIARESGGAALLFSMWCAYPAVKLVHEFAHGLAVRVWGGEVREIGLTVMALTPVPYVDASAATQFAQRRHRVFVGAAGIMAELVIAALALAVWIAASPVWLQQAALAVVLLCSLSTVLFNANPLLRFDGYFMLADAIEMPNLGQRADAVVASWLHRLLGVRHTENPADSAAQAGGLAAYAVAAFVYRWVVGVAVIVWLHESHPLVALVASALVAASLVLRPLWRGSQFLLWDARLNGRRARAVGLSALVMACAALVLGLVPAPLATVQRGVVWLPENAVLRAPADGTLRALLRPAGSRVEAGDAVVDLENLDLVIERESAHARAVALDVKVYDALFNDPAKARRLSEELSALQGRIERLDERLASMQLRAGVAGTLMLPRLGEREGHFFAHGSELGYVLNDDPMLVKVALTEEQAALVRGGPREVTVRLSGNSGEVLQGRIEREAPSASRELPVAALGSSAGGPIPVDPADAHGRTALAPVVTIDVRVPSLPGRHIGMQAWVRFEHESEPVLNQVSRHVRQLFLRSLGSRG
jgi:putative peptide zinc metalloprotease protein